jgi:hypothetical protein
MQFRTNCQVSTYMCKQYDEQTFGVVLKKRTPRTTSQLTRRDATRRHGIGVRETDVDTRRRRTTFVKIVDAGWRRARAPGTGRDAREKHSQNVEFEDESRG